MQLLFKILYFLFALLLWLSLSAVAWSLFNMASIESNDPFPLQVLIVAIPTGIISVVAANFIDDNYIDLI